MSTGVYSPKHFDLIVSKPSLGLNHVVTGYASGTGISLAPFSDRQSAYFGVKGEFSVNVHAVRAYNLTTHLAQTSRSNDIFYKLAETLWETYDPTFEVYLVDRASGTTSLFDKQAIFTTEAEWGVADEIGTRDWLIVLPNPQGSVGGTGTFSSADEVSFNNLGGTVPAEFRPKQ